MLNTYTFLGRFTKDPELKDAGQTQVVNFNVAIDNSRKDKAGNYKTTFMNCVAFGGQAEAIAKGFKKGDRIGIVGELEQDKYTDKNGNTQYNYRVLVDKYCYIELKDKKPEEESEQPKFDPYTGQPLQSK